MRSGLARKQACHKRWKKQASFLASQAHDFMSGSIAPGSLSGINGTSTGSSWETCAHSRPFHARRASWRSSHVTSSGLEVNFAPDNDTPCLGKSLPKPLPAAIRFALALGLPLSVPAAFAFALHKGRRCTLRDNLFKAIAVVLPFSLSVAFGLSMATALAIAIAVSVVPTSSALRRAEN